MTGEIDQLREDIAKTSLRMPSALTPAYTATLDAVDALEHGSVQTAVRRLWDAAASAEREADRNAFESLAERAEEISDG